MPADQTPRPCDRTGVISAEMDPDYDPPSTSLNPPPGPSLVYTTTDGNGFHEIDTDRWDPASLPPRERAVCLALLKHAIGRLRREELAPPRLITRRPS